MPASESVYCTHTLTRRCGGSSLCSGIPLHISVAFQVLQLDLRLCLTFVSRAPYVGSLKFSLVWKPATTYPPRRCFWSGQHPKRTWM